MFFAHTFTQEVILPITPLTLATRADRWTKLPYTTLIYKLSLEMFFSPASIFLLPGFFFYPQEFTFLYPGILNAK